MRVLTLNLWGRQGSWDARRSALIDGLTALQPDLVAFQESIKTDEYDQASDLLGPEYHIAHQRERDREGMGISIASRWPLREVRELDLHLSPRTGEFPCAALMAELEAPDPIGPVLFVNHFPNWELAFEHERELQAVAAARFIEEILDQRDLHVIVAGDFDADPEATSVRFWSGRHALDGMSVCYRDAWESAHPGEPGHTFTPRNALMNDWDWPFRRIDYVFVRCGLHGGPTLRIQGCSLAFDTPTGGVQASDHFGVVADLDLPERDLTVALEGKTSTS